MPTIIDSPKIASAILNRLSLHKYSPDPYNQDVIRIIYGDGSKYLSTSLSVNKMIVKKYSIRYGHSHTYTRLINNDNIPIEIMARTVLIRSLTLSPLSALLAP